MKHFRTERFPNTATGIRNKDRAANLLAQHGWTVFSEMLEPGKFKGNKACCLSLTFCLPLAFAAGTSDGFIVVTYSCDIPTTGSTSQQPLLLTRGKSSRRWVRILATVGGVFCALLILLVVIGILASPPNNQRSGTDALVTPKPYSDATPSASKAPASQDTTSRPLVIRPPEEGDRVQLIRSTPLYFRNSVSREGSAGEQFAVIEYHPETKKVYLLSNGADGKPIALNVPEDAVTIVAFAPHTVAATPQPKPQSRYSIFKRWTTPSGDQCKVIVIPASAATESGMLALADQLRQDTATDPNAFVYIFDDQRAAQMRGLDNLTPSEDDFYDKHYMGTYYRVPSKGIHEMEIRLAGFDGPSKIIHF